MEVKHTPGPWSHRNGRIFATDNENLTIANVAKAFDGDYNPVNGNLIAAAPDLLRALENVVFWHGRRLEDEGLLPAAEQLSEIARAMDAIAKATGASNAG